MTRHLITSSLNNISPQIARDNLQLIIEKLANSDLNNLQTIYLYNILYSIHQILIRYETLCREVIFATEFDDDSEKMRKHITSLCKNALYQNLQVIQISHDNINV